MTGGELENIQQAHRNGQLAGNGPFTKKCHQWLQRQSGAASVLLTHSCTAALELAALLLDLRPGDEVILPSYTFVSTANAFVLRGATPVFVDIRPDTFNLDENLVESAITDRTRAIVPVHYAGVACAMERICRIAARHGLRVVEDAAQGAMAFYQGRALGSLGDVGAYSFHETKNLISGEGGCVLVNDPLLASKAEIIWEKGTDRGRYFQGLVDKYTWQMPGSSFLPGEIVAAFLEAQLEKAEEITRERLLSWEYYHQRLEAAEKAGFLRRPMIPEDCSHNAHMYQVLLAEGTDRPALIAALAAQGIHAVFHYVPLHTSPGGRAYGRAVGALPVTNAVAERVLRLPLWIGIGQANQDRVVETLISLLKK
jgi:dTDP-4-amino-4,6-dideoxygalactose transaminase